MRDNSYSCYNHALHFIYRELKYDVCGHVRVRVAMSPLILPCMQDHILMSF